MFVKEDLCDSPAQHHDHRSTTSAGQRNQPRLEGHKASVCPVLRDKLTGACCAPRVEGERFVTHGLKERESSDSEWPAGADGCHPQNDLSFITPSPMEALSGSCLWIPCTYKVLRLNKDINTADPVTGIWFKGYYGYSTDSQYKFSVSGDSSKSYPMNFTGNLKNKNCTTMFYNLSKSHNDKYYFRVENSGFKATAVCDSLQIKVRDSPWSPTIEVSGKQTETEVVTITCSAVTPCPHAPPQLTWDLHQGTAHITETSGTFTTKITHTLTLTSSHDGHNITCSAAYPANGGHKMSQTTRTLSVTLPGADESGPSVVTWIGPYNIVKLCGIILLYSSLLLLECWFRSTCVKKQEQSPEAAAHVNRVIENQDCVKSEGADGCLFQTDLSIKTPSPMEALSGSCLWIPCTYKPVNTDKDINTADPVTGIWFKGGPGYSTYSQYTFSVSGDSSKSYPMNFTGNLKNKNCTTMFYNLNKSHDDKYYFRVQNSGFSATAVCDSLQIKVRDSPWSPTIEVSGKQTETEVVTITCSAVTPCPHAPPQLTWDLHQGTAHITETSGTFTTKITQNITLTDAHDGLMIKCNAAYPVSGRFKMADSKVTLSVSYGPKNTSVEVSPSGSLSAGQSVTLSCSSRAKPPVHHFTWFRHSSQGPANVSQGHTYSFNLTEEGQYYCVASNTLGNQSSQNITLSITGEAGDVTKWLPAVIVLLVASIILIVLVWYFKFRRTHLQPAQVQTIEEVTQQEPAQSEDSLHYGAVTFNSKTPPAVISSTQEDTVYSQVKTSNINIRAAAEMTDIYAQVQKT
ncbi:sialoadhesin-like [Periophthalmus magnuspinnatus]|uniref:sialoadhesin-like n=1 Tax=Periophthalmus magnuspinnatus TaxID=409849 RepID=UPI0024363595|nr:sialoadhesin-like [Periophthalmus magnuspinnatus]